MEKGIMKQGQVLPAITEKDLTSFLDLYGFSKISAKEKGQFLKVCQMNNLNPFNREAYVVAYGEGKYRTFAIITGFQVYLDRAERSGLLEGWNVSELEACKTAKIRNGKPVFEDDFKCTITIDRHGFKNPFQHTVKYSEFAKKKKDGTPTEFWQKPEMMLKKVAMGQGFRFCFPAAVGSLPYTDAEFNSNIQDAESVDVTEQKELENIKTELTKKELKITLEKLNNFDISISELRSEMKKNNMKVSKEQAEKIKDAGNITSKMLPEIAEIIQAGAKELENFKMILDSSQYQIVSDILLENEIKDLK